MSTQAGELLGNILIVDDTPNNLRLLSQMLSEQGYGVRAVTSGPRALASVRATPPDLILLDIRMPGMNGYEVCERLKGSARTRDIPIVFISALDEIQDKVRAFTVGGVDYVTKPFQIEEVLARVETHLAVRRLQKQLQDANARFGKELALAGRIQASFLPSDLPAIPGWQLSVALNPARETSGDFYDINPLPNGRLGILVADVVDKGVGAALYMALSWALIRTYAADFPTQPELALTAVHRRLLHDTEGSQFVTVFYGILDPANGTLVFCNAGHSPPCLVRAPDGQTVQELHRTGMALGVIEDATWEKETVQLAPGDALVLYTDGVTDAEDNDGAFFGRQRLKEATRTNQGCSAQEVRDALMAEIHEFVDDRPQSDDIALMVVVRNCSED